MPDQYQEKIRKETKAFERAAAEIETIKAKLLRPHVTLEKRFSGLLLAEIVNHYPR